MPGRNILHLSKSSEENVGPEQGKENGRLQGDSSSIENSTFYKNKFWLDCERRDMAWMER